MQQGAVGTVRVLQRDNQTVVEKRMVDPIRHDTEVRALRGLEHSDLPVPRLIRVRPGSIVMSHLPGVRPDDLDQGGRLRALRESAARLRTLHGIPPPSGLSAAPDDAAIVRRYEQHGGPTLPLTVPPASGAVFCHGDWTEGNLLAVNGRITGIVDWEAAHVGDPIRELSRAVWAAGRRDREARTALQEGYGADPSLVDAWLPIHGAELWLWFRAAGPPEYLDQLTSELRNWPE